LYTPKLGANIQGIKEMEMDSVNKLLNALKKGNKNRRVGSTNINEVSSRSHAIL